jgi:hypothetical protein
MEWFDQRFDVYEKAIADQKAVQEFADSIYGEVWSAVHEVVKRAKARGVNLQSNGFSNNIAVKMDQRILTMKLDADKCGITAAISNDSDITLTLRVCADGTVCIKHDGATVDCKGAAKVIMEAFLFKTPSPYAFLFPGA